VEHATEPVRERDGPRHVLRPRVDGLDAVLAEVYRRGCFHREERPYVRPTGRDAAARIAPWAMDLRVALGRSELLTPIATAMAAVLRARGIVQIAGRGHGAFMLVGGILAVGDGIAGGLVRETRKAYGFQCLVEGALDPSRPVVVIDDILSSGRAAARTVDTLRAEGHRPVGVLVVFEYAWRDGRARVRESGVGCRRLATLHRRGVVRPLDAPRTTI
jgi:orotate phosphoribosyltransferase